MVDINANATSVGELEQCSCLESRLGRVYAYPASVGEFGMCSCLQSTKINILKAYTQPITAIIERGI